MADDPTTPAVDETPAAPVEAAPVADTTTPEATPNDDVFPREYVEKLRKENSTYRTRAKEFDDVFDGLDAEDKDWFLKTISTYKDQPLAAAQLMNQVGNELLRRANDESDNPEYVTPEQMQSFFDAQRAKVEEEAAVAAIEAQAKELGYAVDSWQYKALLGVAMSDPDSDVQKAHETLQEWRNSAVPEYIAAKAADAQSVPTAPAAGTVPSGEQPAPKTFEQARAAARERLNAQPISE